MNFNAGALGIDMVLVYAEDYKMKVSSCSPALNAMVVERVLVGHEASVIIISHRESARLFFNQNTVDICTRRSYLLHTSSVTTPTIIQHS